MGYSFFLSYARLDYDEYMKRFVKDLQRELSSRLGWRRSHPPVFFDESGIELGETWDEKLAHALQESKVFIFVLSPAYVQSEYCGKEFSVFQNRVDTLAGRAKPAPPERTSPPLKPIVWVPFTHLEVPNAISRIHHSIGDHKAAHNSIGLRQMRVNYTRYKRQYWDYLSVLSDDLLTSCQEHDLPRLEDVEKLSKVTSAFHMQGSAPGATAGPPVRRTGPKFVDFVFVAARPEEFPAGLTVQVDGYREDGGRDWKPFYPTYKQTIRALAQNVSSEFDLGLYSNEMEITNALCDAVRQAQEDMRMIVVFLDPWSMYVERYASLMREFDQYNFANCCIIVPWNADDREAVAKRAQLSSILEQVLIFRATVSNSPFYRSVDGKEDDLKRELREVLVRLRARITERAKISRAIPRGPSKPILNVSSDKG